MSAAPTWCLNRLRPTLEKYGSRINIEDHSDATFDVLRVIEATGSHLTGVCLDTANTLVNGEDPIEAAKRVAPYALLSPERINLRAIHAAPFFNSRSSSPADGMEKSYEEIVRLLTAMGRSGEVRICRGAREYLRDGNTPVQCEAVDNLIELAMAQPDDRPLFVAAIGACTNIASALLKKPSIARKISVIWLGGHTTCFPYAQEFNLSQDVPAARILFDCGVPLTLIPCLGVASHLLTSIPELERWLSGKNALCDMLLQEVREYTDDSFAWGKEIWDVSTIAYLIQPEWVPTKLTHSPLLTDDSHWAHDERRHLIREAYFCHRNPIFRDLFRKLAGWS
ncbi:MAG: nucleoside hydrolase [Clostridia bacterium]|nr:nucleoside hydrolase [Clostridia bacterium]